MMPSRVGFGWNGDELVARAEEAARAAIDDTLKATDDDASATHWWRNRTGYLERHIETDPATVEGSRVVGRVGATYSGQKGVRSAFYGLFLEYKTPWLRPAADREFPTLATRVREKFRG